MSMRKPNHRVKDLIDQCPRNTVDVKKELAIFIGLSIRTIDLYYTGKNTNLSRQRAVDFLKYFNKERLSGTKKIRLIDIYDVQEDVQTSEIMDALNLQSVNEITSK